MNESNQIKKDVIEKFLMDKYGFICEWKRLTIRFTTKYYLTEFGDRFKLIGTPLRVSLIKGNKLKGRKNSKGKEWKSGFVVDHFYKNINGKSKVFFSIPRSKLMYMVFKGWPLSKVRSYFFFPKDGNPNNPHLKNLKPFKKYMDGHREIYGELGAKSGELSPLDIIKIRKSKKTNRELGEKYGRTIGTISRIRNGRSYKSIKKLI